MYPAEMLSGYASGEHSVRLNTAPRLPIQVTGCQSSRAGLESSRLNPAREIQPWNAVTIFLYEIRKSSFRIDLLLLSENVRMLPGMRTITLNKKQRRRGFRQSRPGLDLPCAKDT